jgi:HPt (histidine-containing phosphotransfer) domain-containing protein
MLDKPGRSGKPIPSELAQEDESFTDLVEEFVRGLGERVEQIAKAVDSGDFAGLKVLAHQMKGSAGSYGYPILTQRAAEMELHAIGEELDAVQADLDGLRELISRVVIRL